MSRGSIRPQDSVEHESEKEGCIGEVCAGHVCSEERERGRDEEVMKL